MIADIAWTQYKTNRTIKTNKLSFTTQDAVCQVAARSKEKKWEHIFVCFSLLQRQTKLTNSDAFVKVRNKEECRHERLK